MENAGYEGMAIAGYGLAFALLGKLMAKQVFTKAESVDLIDAGLLYLEELGSSTPAVAAARAVLEKTLKTVRELK